MAAPRDRRFFYDCPAKREFWEMVSENLARLQRFARKETHPAQGRSIQRPLLAYSSRTDPLRGMMSEVGCGAGAACDCGAGLAAGAGAAGRFAITGGLTGSGAAGVTARARPGAGSLPA